MAGILCVWANLPDEAIEYYEDEYVPDMRAKNAMHALHCERTTSGFEGDAAGQGSPWPHCTVYDVKDIQKATADKQIHPSKELLAGPLENASFDAWTYREIRKWESKDWSGGARDFTRIASVSSVEMAISSEHKEAILTYFTTVMVPKIMDSPDVRRFRLFEVDNASTKQGASYETKDKDGLLPYFCLVEFETEDYPWDVILDLADTADWKRWFDDQKMVKWQVSHYLVNKLYTEEFTKGVAPQSTNNSDVNSGDD